MSTKLCQWFTPLWVAEALVERFFPKLDGHVVVEPSCGEGAFLKAIPASVRAIGVEIDARLAAVARAETGREIICGDFQEVPLTVEPSVIIGNPPFVMDVIDGFLRRSHELLPAGGRVGFLLPAYGMQTAQRVAGYLDRWSLAAEMIPRNVFPRLREPLVFVTFSKDSKRTLIGMALYREAADVREMDDGMRAALQSTKGSAWLAACELALQRLNGEGTLPQIYAQVERGRPTRTAFWREKIRQTLRHYQHAFEPLGEGRYRSRSAQTFSLSASSS